MKRVMRLAVAAAAMATMGGCATGASDAKASPKKLKVLMIGNSFSICVLKQMPQCVTSAGRELDLCSLYIGGCSLERHWQNVVAATNAEFRPYRVDWSYGGVRENPAAPVAKVVRTTADPWAKDKTQFSANIPEMLTADKWDVVTVQQASHFSWKPATYEPFGGNLVGLIRKLAPQAEIVVQETWSYTPYDGRLKQWGITPEEMYAQIKPAYAGFAARYGFRVIPTGAAVQDFRRAMPSADGITGDPCGSPTGKDKFHLNREGEYLQACTWYATLYRRPAADISHVPDFMTAERAAQMRASADAVCR